MLTLVLALVQLDQCLEPLLTYILKPTGGCMGRGISLVQTMAHMQESDISNVVAQASWAFACVVMCSVARKRCGGWLAWCRQCRS